MHAITRLNIGGPGRHVLTLATGLADRFDFRVATGTAPEAEGELATGDVLVDRLPLVRPVNPAHDVVALARMRRLVGRHRPAIVHSHMAKAGAVARLAARSLRPRPCTVHTFHGHVLSEYFGAATQSAFTALERRLAASTDVLVAVSPEVRDSLLDLGVGRPAQYEVLPLGVDLDPFLRVSRPSGAFRAKLGLSADVPLVGVMARLVPVKDHTTLIDAVARLPGVHLAVLGDGECRGELERQVRSLHLGGRVHFLGWWEDMAEAYADVDLVVLTSRNEGTPMSLIEAAAAGRCIVATDVGGVSSVVRHGSTGLLVPPRDPTTLADVMAGVLQDHGRRDTLGRAAREHAHRHFDVAPSLDAMAALYGELLGRGDVDRA